MVNAAVDVDQHGNPQKKLPGAGTNEFLTSNAIRVHAWWQPVAHHITGVFHTTHVSAIFVTPLELFPLRTIFSSDSPIQDVDTKRQSGETITTRTAEASVNAETPSLQTACTRESKRKKSPKSFNSSLTRSAFFPVGRKQMLESRSWQSRYLARLQHTKRHGPRDLCYKRNPSHRNPQHAARSETRDCLCQGPASPRKLL